jgi:hypothetical protein
MAVMLVLLKEGNMKSAVEIGSDGLIHISSLMIISSGTQVILRVLSRQFKRLQCWYY